MVPDHDQPVYLQADVGLQPGLGWDGGLLVVRYLGHHRDDQGTSPAHLYTLAGGTLELPVVEGTANAVSGDL